MPARKSSTKDKPSAMPPLPDSDAKWGELTSYFTKLGKAISAGDGEAAARLWDAPAFVIGNDVTMPIASLDEVADFFSKGRDAYNEAGIDDAVADIQNVRWLTDKMVLCEVKWPYVTREGENIGQETSTYLLRRDDKGHFKMRAAIMQGGTELG